MENLTIINQKKIAQQRRSNLHKILLLSIKIMPMLISIFYLLNTILTFFNIDVIIISFIASVSLLPLLFMFLCSIVFQFCLYHRMFLYYIFICNLITYIDYKYTLPLSNFGLLMLYMIVSGISLFVILYSYVSNTKFNKSTVTKNFKRFR